ncbi:MAG: coenzyme F420-0:L-glutamate ligase [Candidatus Nitrosocaldus sp.]|nr:coenzyme F420-0:L-glutamate ligase [Candidatus Nitrosocaldus sp.]MDW8275757.1 coenzyme F420-0:L-glutamate ligase [Candidatus Nitrosocaldus sp.]
MKVTGIRVRPIHGRFDLYRVIVDGIRDSGEVVEDGDIVAVSSKFVAMSQGRVVDTRSVMPAHDSRAIASRHNMDPRMAELVLREADHVFAGVPGFLLAVKDGMLAPNAGIDRSNVMHGLSILYPLEPFRIADMLRDKFLIHQQKRVGVVIVDSRLMPTRIGTSGIALAVSGFEPVIDKRGSRDLFGNVMRVTLHAVADSIASAANLVMGETDESMPIALVKGFNARMSSRCYGWEDLAIDHEQCIYVRGLRAGARV